MIAKINKVQGSKTFYFLQNDTNNKFEAISKRSLDFPSQQYMSIHLVPNGVNFIYLFIYLFIFDVFWYSAAFGAEWYKIWKEIGIMIRNGSK